jgi:hypothetical protein
VELGLQVPGAAVLRLRLQGLGREHADQVEEPAPHRGVPQVPAQGALEVAGLGRLVDEKVSVPGVFPAVGGVVLVNLQQAGDDGSEDLEQGVPLCLGPWAGDGGHRKVLAPALLEEEAEGGSPCPTTPSGG